jgi:hypothetical protein
LNYLRLAKQILYDLFVIYWKYTCLPESAVPS